MMREIALHLLDIVHNSIQAGATLIKIDILEKIKEDLLIIRIKDNGRGMDEKEIEAIFDPFYTTKQKKKKVGLGIPLFRDTCRQCQGDLEIFSRKGEGTCVQAYMKWSHIDRPPLGNVAETMWVLICGNPDVDFVYFHCVDKESFELDTRIIKQEVGREFYTHPEVQSYIRDVLLQGEKRLRKIASKKGEDLL